MTVARGKAVYLFSGGAAAGLPILGFGHILRFDHIEEHTEVFGGMSDSGSASRLFMVRFSPIHDSRRQCVSIWYTRVRNRLPLPNWISSTPSAVTWSRRR